VRKLNTGDLFKMAKIIKYAKINEEIESILTEAKDTENEESKKELGVKLFGAIITGCGNENVDAKFYDLIAGITDKTVKDIENMELETLFNICKEIVKTNDIARFFKSAGQLTK
jgi:hypothetical protein